MEDYWDCKRPRSFKITLIVVRGMWIRIKITINYHKCDYFFCHIMVIVVQISISESSITHAVSFVSISFLFSRTNCKHQLLLGDLLDNGSANHEGVQRLSIILDWFSMYTKTEGVIQGVAFASYSVTVCMEGSWANTLNIVKFTDFKKLFPSTSLATKEPWQSLSLLKNQEAEVSQIFQHEWKLDERTQFHCMLFSSA